MADIPRSVVTQIYYEVENFKGGLKEVYFPRMHRLTEQRIDLHSYIEKRIAAPFTDGIAPNYKRNAIHSNEFEIPEISQQVIVDNKAMQTVLPGMNPYRQSDTMPPKQFKQILYATKEIRDNIRRTHDIASAEVLTTAKLTLPTSDDLDFNRNGKFNFTADWSDISEAAASVEATLSTFFELSHEANLPQGDLVLLLGAKAAASFMKNKGVQNILDNRRYDAMKYKPGMVMGNVYSLGSFIFPELPLPVQVHTYNETYKQSDGTEAYIFPENSAVFTSLMSPRHTFYGGVSYAQRKGAMNAEEVIYPGDEVLFDVYPSEYQRAVFSRGVSMFLPAPSQADHLLHATITT